MVLAGKVNKGLVALLRKNGGNAVGLCGLDGGMLRVDKMRGEPDLGRVGSIERVEPALINLMLDHGFVPVIATVGTDAGGLLYNINADTAAAAIAGALKADRFIFMTDVKGVLRDRGDEASLIPELCADEVPALVETGVLSGGMLPKIQSCLDGLLGGVGAVSIIDGRIEHSILGELASETGIGTRIYRRNDSGRGRRNHCNEARSTRV
jgi:acetylglutamate kinase